MCNTQIPYLLHARRLARVRCLTATSGQRASEPASERQKQLRGSRCCWCWCWWCLAVASPARALAMGTASQQAGQAFLGRSFFGGHHQFHWPIPCLPSRPLAEGDSCLVIKGLLSQRSREPRTVAGSANMVDAVDDGGPLSGAERVLVLSVLLLCPPERREDAISNTLVQWPRRRRQPYRIYRGFFLSYVCVDRRHPSAQSPQRSPPRPS